MYLTPTHILCMRLGPLWHRPQCKVVQMKRCCKLHLKCIIWALVRLKEPSFRSRYNCDAVAPSTAGGGSGGGGSYAVTNCTSRPSTLCLGNRNFLRREKCNWTSGYSWGTALVLSITLGGFGADRFVLFFLHSQH